MKDLRNTLTCQNPTNAKKSQVKECKCRALIEIDYINFKYCYKNTAVEKVINKSLKYTIPATVFLG